MSFAIVINEKGGQPRRQEFLKGEITIGRVQGNDIVLPKQNVSKRHSRIVLKNGKFVISDLKSTNGTYVNGRKITTPMVIKETDKIYIGDFVLSTELIDGVSEGASNPNIAPPPPPANSLPGARPPFPGGMPSKTIASGMSPFAQPEPASAPMTSIAPPPPMAMEQNSSPAPSPFGQPAAPAVPPVSSPVPAPPAPPTPPAPPAPTSSPFAKPAQSLTGDAVPVVAEAPAVVEAPAAPMSNTPASPFGSPVAPVAPASAVPPASPVQSNPAAPFVPSPPASLRAPSAAVHSPSPSAMNIDASVFDGQEDNAPLVKIHQALNEGLSQQGLSTPHRYRPGQSLNQDLVNAALEVLKPFSKEHSEETISQVIDEAFSVGALGPLAIDETVTEIYLNGAHQLVYRQGQSGVVTVKSPFSSVEQAQRAALRLLNGLGREGEQRGEGRLGNLRVLVDLNGAEGPYVCMQRPIQQKSLSEYAHFDQNVVRQLSSLLAQGGKLMIASRSVKAQAMMSSMIAHECYSDRRVAIIGANHHIGNKATWFTLEGSDEALKGVQQLTPDIVMVQDQACLNGELVFETLSAASGGMLLSTARNATAAISKLQRRAGHDHLAVEAIDLVIFVTEDGNQQMSVEQIYSLTQGVQVYSQGTLTGDLV